VVEILAGIDWTTISFAGKELLEGENKQLKEKGLPPLSAIYTV
jgi:hypothetical protein